MTPSERMDDLTRHWRMEVRAVTETATSLIAHGKRGTDDVVLKVVKTEGDEWHSGALAASFAGHGMVRVYQTLPGAALMEELKPGTPLVDVVDAGNDDEATRIIASVVRHMSRIMPATSTVPTADQWARSFTHYLAGTDHSIARGVVEDARNRYEVLCATQSHTRVLHGDLQHYNILYDEARGWVAIDPKGVVAEVEFELAAALRNPHGRPDLVADTSAVAHRIRAFAEELGLDAARIAAWAYVQAVLSAVWTVEDEGAQSEIPALSLARALHPLVGIERPPQPG